MSTLYCLSHAPGADPFQNRLVSMAKEGDAILLIEDGIYATIPGKTSLHETLNQIQNKGIDIFISAPDIEARGVSTVYVTVDYAGMIDLMTKYERIVH